jgi:DNA replication licensing factor MCM7
MALLQHKALADYAKQLDAFQSFLQKFETSKTSSDAAAEAIDGLHLDSDHTSDEYDFMDDVSDEGDGGLRRRPKRKYMDMLQEVANRERQNILIELDDLQEVRNTRSQVTLTDNLPSLKIHCPTT